ncbi:MAG: glycosyltransferase [Chloroflexi bacterium]|nr:glycosyltransferase [Chloroflexota bacterium]
MNILFIHEVDWLKKVVFDIHTLAESLSLRGHQVYAVDYESMWTRKSLFDFGGWATREVNGVARAYPGASVSLRRPGVIKIPGISRLSAGFTQYGEIQRTIKEKSIDVIVLYGVATNGLQTTHLARKFHIPVVFRSIDILNQLVPYAILRPVTRFLEKKVYSKVDLILTLTPKLSDYVIAKGAEKSRVKLLPMPVDTGLFHPATDFGELRKQWGFAEKDQVILFIGTLFDFSGLDVLIPRFAEVTKQVPAAKLLIVGDGPQRPKLAGIIANCGLQERVIITGFQPYQTMPQYINLATICINTFLITEATRDIFPGKIVQYLACGKAVIATPLPGMIAVIPGEEQGVVYTGNVDEMVREMVSLLKSAERRRQLESNGLNYVTQVHSHDKIAQQLETRLEEAIQEKRNGKSSQRV